MYSILLRAYSYTYVVRVCKLIINTLYNWYIQMPEFYDSAAMTDDVVVVFPEEYINSEEFRALQASFNEAIISVRDFDLHYLKNLSFYSNTL